MLKCTDIRKAYPTRQGPVLSLDQVSLEVEPGEFIVAKGPSGCGKTTLLLLLGGMLRPTAGRVEFTGRALYDLPPRERARFRSANVGFVFQMFHLVPYLSVVQNVLLAAPGKATRADHERSAELLGKLGLSARAHHRPGQLSAGERQRTALARALLNRPRILLADEPTGNLDPTNAAEVFRHLNDFRADGGAVLVVTHGDAGDAFATRVLRMSDGRVVSDTPGTASRN